MNADTREHEEGIREYLSFAESHPEMFVNPPGAGYVVLLQEHEIEEAEAEAAENLKRKGLPPSWSQVGIVYRDPYSTILRDAVRFPDGRLGTYVRTCRPDGAPGVVVLTLHEDKVLILRHFRHATRQWHLEVPRGFGEKGLSWEENARKELFEETGSQPSFLAHLGGIYIDSGIGSPNAELFFAKIDSVGQPQSDEAISELLELDFKEFERMIREGDIDDSFTLAAYARAKLRGFLPD